MDTILRHVAVVKYGGYLEMWSSQIKTNLYTPITCTNVYNVDRFIVVTKLKYAENRQMVLIMFT